MVKKKKPRKEFSNTWIFEGFDRDPSFATKRMFGGLAAYVQGRMVMMLAESPGDRQWRGVEYDFDIWDGLMLPTEREYHADLQKNFKNLLNHPVLPKWLYLPAIDNDFENTATEIAKKISEGDKRFGIEPSIKSKKRKKKT